MVDLHSLSESELQTFIEQAEKTLKEIQFSKRKDVILQIRELAASIGAIVDIREVEKFTDKRNSKVDPKYRNPANPLQTWTGRGLPPKWLQALIASGRNKTEFEIR